MVYVVTNYRTLQQSYKIETVAVGAKQNAEIFRKKKHLVWKKTLLGMALKS